MTGARAFSARAGDDDRIHLVDAPEHVLIDPAPYRTRCGERVFEVFNTPFTVTCQTCLATER